MVEFLIMLPVSVIFIIFGLLIWKKGRIDLIHNYHKNNVKDYEGYGNAMGKTILSMEILMLIVGMIFLLENSELISVGFLFIVFLICILFITIIQKKYNGSMLWFKYKDY